MHKLPVVESWEDIDLVVSQNVTLRAEINAEVALEWKKYTAIQRKEYLMRNVFKNPEVHKRIVEGYRSEELDVFDPQADFKYYIIKLWQEIEKLGFEWKTNKKACDTLVVANDILGFLKRWVECHKGWQVILELDKKRREKLIQRVIHGFALSYIEANKLDMSCEPDEGRGPLDFKVSMGCDKTLIEVKLSTNDQYLHGYEVQIEEYGKAEKTNKLIYCFIDLGHPKKVKKIQELHDKRQNDGENPPELIIIDSTPKESASRA